jgi:hypothetical protein
MVNSLILLLLCAPSTLWWAQNTILGHVFPKISSLETTRQATTQGEKALNWLPNLTKIRAKLALQGVPYTLSRQSENKHCEETRTLQHKKYILLKNNIFKPVGPHAMQCELTLFSFSAIAPK